MKNVILLFIISINLCSFAQSEKDIASIRTYVEQTNLHLKDFNSFNIDDTINAKNEIIIFTEELNKIRLIKESYNNNTGKTIIWNYIINKQPIFIYKEYFKNKIQTTDFMKTEERFYLKNNRIIRWMKDKKIIKKYPTNAADIENNMLEHINSLITKFDKENIE